MKLCLAGPSSWAEMQRPYTDGHESVSEKQQNDLEKNLVNCGHGNW